MGKWDFFMDEYKPSWWPRLVLLVAAILLISLLVGLSV